MSAKLQDKDTGMKRRLADLHQLHGYVAKVGIQGEKALEQHEGSELTIAEVGAVHEFGAPSANIPTRSFLRSAYDSDPKKWEGELRKELSEVIKKKGTNYKHALTVVAEKLRTTIIDLINAGIPPPLKPATIARKGGESTPLLETGALRGAITAVVGKPGSE